MLFRSIAGGHVARIGVRIRILVNVAVALASGVGGEGQIVLQVTDVNSEAASDALDNQDQQMEAVARASGDDILDQMVSSLQSAYGVSINRALAERSMQ